MSQPRTAHVAPLRRRLPLMVLAGFSPLLLGGCSKDTVDQMKRLGLPQSSDDRSAYMFDLWIGAWITAGLIGVLVWGLIFWTSFHYRRRGDDEVPRQVRYNLPMEMLYTVAPVIIILVLFFFTVKTDNQIGEKVTHPDHTITVTAQQWSWTFNYVDDKALGGHTDVYDIGTPALKPTLWLPVGESVTFTLHSPDVIHSFWVPSFYFKMDVIPGRHNSFSMTPTRLGQFDGRCAELCGLHHSRMLFTVNIVTPAQYDAHLRDLRHKGQTGLLLGGSHADTPAGLSTNEGAG